MKPGPGVRLLLDTKDEAFHWTAPKIVLSVFLFLAAGVCEIGGGWLIWHALRGKLLPEPQKWWQSPKAYLYVVAGGVTLVGYGYDPPLLAVHAESWALLLPHLFLTSCILPFAARVTLHLDDDIVHTLPPERQSFK